MLVVVKSLFAFFDLENGNQELKSDKDVYINTSMGRRRAVDVRAPHLH